MTYSLRMPDSTLSLAKCASLKMIYLQLPCASRPGKAKEERLEAVDERLETGRKPIISLSPPASVLSLYSGLNGFRLLFEGGG
jgi:hypothetical protein